MLEFSSRIFVDSQWRKVDFANGAVVDDCPDLQVLWQTENFENWNILRVTLENSGDQTVKLGALHILEGTGIPDTSPDDVIYMDSGFGVAGAMRVNAASPEYMEKWQTYYLAEEDIAWGRKFCPGLENGAHYSLGGMMVHFRLDHPTWIFGFMVPLKRCCALPLLMADPDTGEVKKIALSNNFAGYELAPGEKIQTEDIMIGSFENPYDGIEEWATLCEERRKVEVWPKRPPMGWLSWYGYRLEQNEIDTLRTADLLRDKLAGLDFEYIQLDLGYFKDNLPGEFFETNDNYPHGLEHLKRELDNKGYKLGVWLCPFLIAADSQFAREHPEALLAFHPNDGDKWHWEPFCRMYQLDSTHPEGEKFLRRTISHFKSIGVKYFKLDFCGRMGRVDKDFTPFDRKNVKGVEVYRRGLSIIMDMMDDDDYVYWCSNLLHFGIGYGATSMACNDIGNTGFTQARKVEGRVEDISYFKRAATTIASRYFMHQKLLLLNPDSLNVAPPADMAECRLRATLVAMSGGQFFLGDRFDLAEPDRLELIKQTCPPYGIAARPLDLFEHVYPEDCPRIWHLPVNSWDVRDLIAIFNYGGPEVLDISLGRYGLDTNKTYHLWDFWNRRYIGKTNDTFSYAFSGQEVLLTAIVPERNHPWVLSTSFHFTQGGIELSEVKWDEESLKLTGKINRPGKMQGYLYIHVPDTYRCKLEEIAENIYKFPLTGQGQPADWKIVFAHSWLMVYTPEQASEPDEKITPEKNIKLLTENKWPYNPWISIWTRPRATIQQIIDSDPCKYVLLLAALNGISGSFQRASNKNLGEKHTLSMLVLGCIIAGPIGGILIIYLHGLLIKISGKLLNGKASPEEIRAALAWGYLPVIWGILLLPPQLVLFGNKLFTPWTPNPGDDILLFSLYYLFMLADLILGIWSFVITLKCIGQVQGFSAWKALLNEILAGILILIPILALIFLVSLLK